MNNDQLLKDMVSVQETVREYAQAIDSIGYASGLDEYPLEIVDQRGREYAVVLCTGGPHIEIVADGLQNARLEGYWWGQRATLFGDEFSTVLDYFIERS